MKSRREDARSASSLLNFIQDLRTDYEKIVQLRKSCSALKSATPCVNPEIDPSQFFSTEASYKWTGIEHWNREASLTVDAFAKYFFMPGAIA